MAKRDINRKTRKCSIPLSEYRRQQMQIRLTDMIKENKKREEPQKGVKALVLEQYAQKGKNGAYYAIMVINKKLKKQAFPKEVVDNWIEEYEKNNQKENNAR